MQVLVVEDDPDTCANLCDILGLDGHEVSTATSAGEALAHPALTAVDVALLDRKLPDLAADELLPQLKQRAPDAEVIIVTGHGDLASAISALRLGANDYLLKPINPDALRVSLKRISETHRLRRARRQSEDAFRNLVQAAPSMIVILRSDHTIAYFSPFAEQLTGYSADQVTGKDYFEIFLPQSERGGVDVELRRIMEGTPTRGYENPIRCRDGRLRWLVWNAQRIDDFDGGPAVLAAGLDVTEQKRAVERLLQAERLAGLGEAMANLAHESRNALQRSQACLELLARRVEDRPEATELLKRIQTAQDDLHQLYEEVREYAAPLKLSRQRCDVREVLRETWDHLAVERTSRSAALMLDSRDVDANCDVDRFAIGRAFRNVLENSLAACSDPVEIRAGFRQEEFNGTPALAVHLCDNGAGLSAVQRERIFEPFYTTKTHGTGLGMAICKRVVEAHGGSIQVGPGPGAEIVIKLPRESP